MQSSLSSKKEKISQELLFVLYFWCFTLLRPLLQHYPEKSKTILLIFTLIIIVISTMKLVGEKIYIQMSYALLGAMLSVLSLDYIFRPNNFIVEYAYEFIIYGIIPIHVLSQTKSLKRLLSIFSYFSVIVFLLYFMDPIRGYIIFTDYMDFGFAVALPAYFGMHIGRRFFHRKWMLPLEILCLLEMLIFANRSASLSVLMFWIMLEIFYIDKSSRKTFRIILFMVVGVIMFVFAKDILAWIISTLKHYGYFSYSLWQVKSYLTNGDVNGLLSGRADIWILARDMIVNNWSIGAGTGAFEAQYLSYTHNLYYDLMTQYGLIGLIGFSSLIIKALKRVLEQKHFNRLAGLFFLCMWCPKLFFSLYLFKDISIWCFLAYGLINFERYVKENYVC